MLLRAVDQDPGAAVRRPDEGAARLARCGRARRELRARLARRCGSTSIRMPASASRSSPSRMRRSAPRPRSRCKRKRVTAGPALPGKARRLHQPGSETLRAVPGRRRFGRRLRQAGARSRDAGHHAVARQDPEHLGSVGGRDQLPRRKCTTSRVAMGIDPGTSDLSRTALSQDLHPRGRGLRRPAHRDAAVRAVPAALPAAGGQRPRVRRHAAAVSHRCRQERLLRARRCRARRAAQEDRERRQDARPSRRSRASRVSAK